MDIKAILKDEAEELLDIELNLLEEELLTGDFTPSYIDECTVLIDEIRKSRLLARNTKQDSSKSSSRTAATIMPIDPVALSPYGSPVVSTISELDVVEQDIAVMRRMGDYKTKFKCYLKSSAIIDEEFCDAHFTVFNEGEWSALLETIQFSESFLEKYFCSFDTKEIARYQLFSEEFFMRHYSDLDAEIVLKHGKNPWRFRQDMSQKMEMFLKLKGVQL